MLVRSRRTPAMSCNISKITASYCLEGLKKVLAIRSFYWIIYYLLNYFMQCMSAMRLCLRNFTLFL